MMTSTLPMGGRDTIHDSVRLRELRRLFRARGGGGLQHWCEWRSV
jgi:hypothetical protein